MKRRVGLTSLVGSLLITTAALAEQYAFVGHRAAGMGGANAASVNDSSAQWHNPSAFGFFGREPDPVDGTVTNAVTDVVPAEVIPEQARADNGGLGDLGFGWNVFGFGVGYTMTDEMPDYITALGEINFDSFGGDGLDGTAESVESMLLLGSTLYGLGSNPDNAFYVDATAGMNFRIRHLGIGIRFFGEAAGYVDYLDTANLGVSQSEAGFIAAVNTAAGADGFNPVGYTYQTINPGDMNISGSAGGADAEAYLDYQLTQLKKAGVVSDKQITDAVVMANLITYGQDPNDPNSTSYENNTSTMTARGFGLVEVPFSYGHAFNDNFSIGVTAKAMYGTVTGTKVRFVDENSLDAAMDNVEENTEATMNFGLDLGMMYRMKMLQFAAVAHNINAPKFDGFTDVIEIKNDAGTVVATVPIDVPDYRIDPQITLGAAFIPSERFMLEISYDLLETGTLLDNYDIQRLSFGGELDIWLLAFRLGMYNNLAADWQDWVTTAGVGLNLFGVRFDVGGAVSLGDDTDYEGTTIPEEARVYAAMSLEF